MRRSVRRIKAFLISPKGIVDYLSDRGRITFIIIVVFCLLFALPECIMVGTSKTISGTIATELPNSISNAEVNYRIENSKLVKDEGVEATLVKSNITLTTFMFDSSAVFSLDGDTNFIENINAGTNILFIFSQDKVTLSVAFGAVGGGKIENRYDITSINYDKLNEKNFNFATASATQISSLINDIIDGYYQGFMHKFGWLIVTYTAFSGANYYLITILLITALSLLLYKSLKIGFGKTFKIVVYSSLPYVIFNLIGTLVGFSLIRIIGILMMIFYINRVIVGYKLKMLYEEKENEQKESDDNEL